MNPYSETNSLGTLAAFIPLASERVKIRIKAGRLVCPPALIPQARLAVDLGGPVLRARFPACRPRNLAFRLAKIVLR